MKVSHCDKHGVVSLSGCTYVTSAAVIGSKIWFPHSIIQIHLWGGEIRRGEDACSEFHIFCILVLCTMYFIFILLSSRVPEQIVQSSTAGEVERSEIELSPYHIFAGAFCSPCDFLYTYIPEAGTKFDNSLHKYFYFLRKSDKLAYSVQFVDLISDIIFTILACYNDWTCVKNVALFSATLASVMTAFCW